MSILPTCAGQLGLPLSPSLRSRRPDVSSRAPPLAISAGKAAGRWCVLMKAKSELNDVSGYGGGAGDQSETGWDDSEIGLGRRKERPDWEHLINESSQWLMAIIFGGAVVWKHDAQILWTAAGALLNAWSSLALKLMLKEERPTSSLSSSPGMPSSHAQSLFYGIVVLLVSMFQWLGINAFSIIIGILIFMVGSYLSWLRVSQQCHTISQVVVGAALGTIVSAGWIYMWQTILLHACVSFLWVRIAVISGSICFCSAFFLYFTKYWIPR